MATMLVIEDTPKKMMLKMDASQPKYNPWKGCFLPILGINIFLIPIFICRASSYHFSGSQFWKETIVVSLVEVVLISIFVSLLRMMKKDVKEATVSIDLDTQQATRIEKLNSGETKQYELRFEQISQILIHGQEAGHQLTVTLESPNNPPLKVNSDVFFDTRPMIELGKKLGNLIRKPVIFKTTEGSQLVSEETIQE
jgi:hypothetical protein